MQHSTKQNIFFCCWLDSANISLLLSDYWLRLNRMAVQVLTISWLY